MIGFAVMLAATAYLVRGLQMLLGTSKRAMTERAEEMGTENDDIPLTEWSRATSSISEAFSTEGEASRQSSPESIDSIALPLRAQDPSLVRGTGGPPMEEQQSQASMAPPVLRQDPVPLTRAQKLAAVGNVKLDVFAYAVVFLFIGVPIYYASGYAMPMQLALNVLAYFAALALPGSYKRYLHPVLVSSGITILGIWVMALCRHNSLHDSLHAYSTKTRYLQLWNGQNGLQRPGAGDVFSSVLDVSIVALALPMFQYRNELRRHVSTHLSDGVSAEQKLHSGGGTDQVALLSCESPQLLKSYEIHDGNTKNIHLYSIRTNDMIINIIVELSRGLPAADCHLFRPYARVWSTVATRI